MELVFRLLRYLNKYCIDAERRENTSHSGAGENIKNIINYLDQHFMEEITLAGVAKEFHYTSAHLSRLFKKHIGFNFYEYLQSVRLMNCVEEMKRHPNIRITRCAIDNGFPNARSFIEMFKKTFGCTPSEWMKK